MGGAATCGLSRDENAYLSKSEVISITKDSFSESMWRTFQKNGKISVGQLLDMVDNHKKKVGSDDFLDFDSGEVYSSDVDVKNDDSLYGSDDSSEEVHRNNLSFATVCSLRVTVMRLKKKTSFYQRSPALHIKRRLMALVPIKEKNRYRPSSKATPRYIFRKIDTDGGGTITTDEWALCLRRQLGLTREEADDFCLKAIFAKMDKNADSRVTIQNFSDWWNSVDDIQMPSSSITSPQNSRNRKIFMTPVSKGEEQAEDRGLPQTPPATDDLTPIFLRELIKYHRKSRRYTLDNFCSDRFDSPWQFVSPFQLFRTLLQTSSEKRMSQEIFRTFLRDKLELGPELASDDEITSLFNHMDTSKTDDVDIYDFANFFQANTCYALDEMGLRSPKRGHSKIIDTTSIVSGATSFDSTSPVSPIDFSESRLSLDPHLKLPDNPERRTISSVDNWFFE